MAKTTMKVGTIAAGIAIGAGLDKSVLHILPEELALTPLEYDEREEVSQRINEIRLKVEENLKSEFGIDDPEQITKMVENPKGIKDVKLLNLIAKIRFLTQLSQNVLNM